MYTQFMLLYTSYIAIKNLKRTFNITRYIMSYLPISTLPLFLYSQVKSTDLPCVELKDLLLLKNTVVITNTPDFFKVLNTKEEDEYENVVLEKSENTHFVQDLSSLSFVLLSKFKYIVIDSRDFNIYCLKIIHQKACFFIPFEKFLEMIKKNEIIIVQVQGTETVICKLI